MTGNVTHMYHTAIIAIVQPEDKRGYNTLLAEEEFYSLVHKRLSKQEHLFEDSAKDFGARHLTPEY